MDVDCTWARRVGPAFPGTFCTCVNLPRRIEGVCTLEKGIPVTDSGFSSVTAQSRSGLQGFVPHSIFLRHRGVAWSARDSKLRLGE
jgi:hypothetical protein